MTPIATGARAYRERTSQWITGGADDTPNLAERVRGEFLEMPGLRVTLTQAQRLMGVDPSRCELVLDSLVESGVLTRTPDHRYTLRQSQP